MFSPLISVVPTGGVTAALALALIASSFECQVRSQPTKPPFLEALTRFDIKGQLADLGFENQSPIRLSASGDRLLIATAADVNGTNGFLVQSDMAGNIRWKVPVKEAILDATVSDEETVAALVEAEPDLTVTLRQFDKNGKSDGVGLPHFDVFRLLCTGKKIFGLTRTGFLRDLTDGRGIARQVFPSGIVLPSGDTYIHALPAGRVRVIDGKTASWSDGSAHSSGPAATLPAPIRNSGIERAAAFYGKSGTADGTIIQAAAGGNSGRSYLLLTGFSPQEGAPIVVMDTLGNVIEEFRLDVRYGGIPDVMPFPLSIAISGNRLAMLDSLGVVTMFRLP